MKKSIFCILIILMVSLSLSAVSAESDTLGISEDDMLQDSDNLEATSGADLNTKMYIIDDSAELVLWGINQTNFGPDVSKDVSLVIGSFNSPSLINTHLTAGNRGSQEASIDWKIGDMAPGQSEFLYAISSKEDTHLIFSFTYTNTYDPDESDNYAVYLYPNGDGSSEPSTPEKSIDYGYSDVDLLSEVKLVNDGGPTFYCHAIVTNTGSSTAKNVVAYVGVPDTTINTAYVRKGSIYKDNALNSYVWNVGDLAPGEKTTFYLDIVKPPVGSSYYVLSTVECDNVESDYGNNFDWMIYTYKTFLTQSTSSSEVNQNSDAVVSNSASAAQETLPSTGNPLIIALLALMTIGTIGLKRKT